MCKRSFQSSITYNKVRNKVIFHGGLDTKIANVIDLHPFSTLEELIILAHKVEKQQKARGKMEASRPFTKTTPYQKPNTILPKPTQPYTPKTPTTTLNPIPNHAPRRCFRCLGLGYIASEYPNKKVVSLMEFKALDEDDEEENEAYEEEDHEEEIVGPYEAECLGVRRTLSGVIDHEETQQREAIFHTRCTIENKVCTLIINGGSCTNVVAQIMVDKLKLPTS